MLMDLSHRNFKDYLADVEKEIILDVYKEYQQNQSQTAKMLGISRTKLIYKLKEYGILK